MCRFHIWNQFLHISLSDGEKNCPRSAKIRACFWNLSRDCDNLRFFWKQIRNLRKKLHLYRDFWRDDVFLVWDMLKSLILVKILLLLFTNSRIGSGPNRPRIRIRHGRKYPSYLESCFFIYFRNALCAPLPFCEFEFDIAETYENVSIAPQQKQITWNREGENLWFWLSSKIP